MVMLRAFLIGVLAVFMTMAQAQDFVPVPPLKTRVTDQVGMLTATERSNLENVLKDYEKRTGSQIAILLMSKTAPEAIEQYSIRVFDEWKLGRKGIDDGVLLIVARDNPPALRRLRIEAGRGVQGTLTDAQSKRILQDVIAPHFRQNDYYGGLSAAVSAITSLLDQEHFAGPGAKPAADEEGEWLPFLLLVGCAAFFFFLSHSRRYGRYMQHGKGWRRSSGVILGGGLGGFGGGGFSGGSGGGFSGGGGTGDGGGASGNW